VAERTSVKHNEFRIEVPVVLRLETGFRTVTRDTRRFFFIIQLLTVLNSRSGDKRCFAPDAEFLRRREKKEPRGDGQRL